MRISLSTVFGVIFGFGIISWGVLSATHDWGIFVSLASFNIVMGGIIAAAFIGFRWRYLLLSMFDILTIFVRQTITPKSLKKDVAQIIVWSKAIQADGKNAIQKIIDEEKEYFTKYVFTLIATGYKEEEVRRFSENSIEEHYFRHLNESNILNSMGSSAPAFGMVGTLIGLIVMLGDLEDPSKMGPGLSMALMTTLYGVLIARFLFIPTASKVKQKLSIKRFREYLLLEGIMLIMQKKNPFYIEDFLNSFLDRSHQSSHVSGGDSNDKGKK